MSYLDLFCACFPLFLVHVWCAYNLVDTCLVAYLHLCRLFITTYSLLPFPMLDCWFLIDRQTLPPAYPCPPHPTVEHIPTVGRRRRDPWEGCLPFCPPTYSGSYTFPVSLDYSQPLYLTVTSVFFIIDLPSTYPSLCQFRFHMPSHPYSLVPCL